MQIALFDTTLRDGTQSEGLSLSVEDKIKITRLLDGFGIHYIEGGYPGSNPKDVEFFQRAPAFRVLPNAVIFACLRPSPRARRKNSMSLGFDPG